MQKAVLDYLHGIFGGNKGTHDPKNRRSHPTFLLPAEPPTWGPTRDKLSFRQRIEKWNNSIVGDLNAFPYIVFVYYTFKIFLFIWCFQNWIRNPNVGLFDEDNIKRMVSLSHPTLHMLPHKQTQ